MKIKPKEVKRRVGILTDPSPTFVSLVDHGANQTPFNTVKRDKVSTQPKTPTARRKDTMTIKKGKGAVKDPVVTQLTFSKSLFATAKKVSDYLTKKGFTDCGEPEDGDDVWIVPSTEDVSEHKLSKAKSTATNDAGVTVFVAEIIGKADPEEENDDDDDDDADDDGDDAEASGDDDDDDDTEEAPVAKKARRKPKAKADDNVEYDTVLDFPPTASGVKKFDWWAGYMSDEGSLTGVLADGIGYDGVPPGVDVLVQATHWTIGNILNDSDSTLSEKKAKLAQMGSDLAELTGGLFELFDGATANVEKSATAKAFVASFKASVEEAAALTLTEGNVTKTVAPKKTETTSTKAVGDIDAEGNETVYEEEVSGAVGERILAALTGLGNRLGAVEKRVERTAKTTDRLSERQPTRKSLSSALDDLVPEPKAKTAEETETEREARLSAAKREMGGAFGYTRSGT